MKSLLVRSTVLLPLFASTAQAQTELFRISQTGPYRSVSGTVDYDGDGVRDILVSGYGSVVVYSGLDGSPLPSLFTTADALDGGTLVEDVTGDGVPELFLGTPYTPNSFATLYSGADATQLFRIQGSGAFGLVVSGMQDLDGDGAGDLLVGGGYQGSVGAFAFSSADGSLLRSFVPSGPPQSTYGSRLATGGDVDADGVDDVLVGTSPSFCCGTRFHVFSGADGSVLYAYEGQVYENLGTALCFVGDLNADGRDEFCAGAPGEGTTGVVHVYDGATGAELHALTPTTPEGFYFGYGLEGGEDLDGDGIPDLLVPMYYDSTNGIRCGRVAAFSSATWLLLGQVLGEQVEAYLGFGLAFLGDPDGDGFPEILATQRGDLVGAHRVFSLYADCNGNRRHDGVEVSAGLFPDCNGNLVPDDCEAADCNGNGLLDACDLASGSSSDCDGNGIPDECDVSSGRSTDCDGDGVLDVCQAALLTFEDVSPELAPYQASVHTIRRAPRALGEVALDFRIRSNTSFGLFVYVGDSYVGNVFSPGCDVDEQSLTVPSGVFNAELESGVVAVSLVPYSQTGACDSPFVEVTTTYAVGPESTDCNGTGIADACEVVTGASADANGNGIPDECEFVEFCTATANSTGLPADIFWAGSNSVSANALVLFAFPLPALANGLFIYSPDQVQIPLGNGYLCLGNSTQGFVNRLPFETSNAAGTMTHHLDLTAPPSPDSLITPGTTWNFQCWFRDVPAGGAFFNFSRGLSVTFLP